MAEGHGQKNALVIASLSKVEPEFLERVGLKEHGCDLLEAWITSLTAGDQTVSAKRFEVPVFDAKRGVITGVGLYLVSDVVHPQWRPADAYGALTRWQADIDGWIALSSVRLCCSSHDFAVTGSGATRATSADLQRLRDTASALKADWPHKLVPLRAGVNVTGDASFLPSVDPQLRALIGLDKALSIAGCVGKTQDGCWIEVSAALPSKALDLLDGALSISLTRATLGAARITAEGGKPDVTVGLHGRIQLDQTDTKQTGTKQTAIDASITFNPASKRLTIAADAPTLVSAGALFGKMVPDLATSMNGVVGQSGVGRFIPGLRRLEVETPLTTFDGARIGLWLTYTEPFTLFDLIDITPSLHVAGSYTGKDLSWAAELTGEGRIGQGADAARFITSFSLPSGHFRAGLAEGSAVSLPESIMSTLAKVGDRQSLMFIDASISGNILQRTCSLSIVSVGFLSFPIGAARLLIGDVIFEVEKSKSGISARFEATIGVGDVDAAVAIEIEDSLTGTIAIPRVPIGALTTDLLQIEAPPELASAEIKDCVARVTLGDASSLSFSAASDSEFTIAGLKASLNSLNVEYNQKLSLKGAGKVRFDTTSVDLNLELKDGTWAFGFEASTRFDLAKALAPLAASVGFKSPFGSASVMVDRVVGQFRLGKDGTRIALNFEFTINDGPFRLTLVAAHLADRKTPGWEFSLKVGPVTVDFRGLPMIGGAISGAVDALAKPGGSNRIGIDDLTMGLLSSAEEADVTALFKGLVEKDFPQPVSGSGKISLTGALRLMDHRKEITYPKAKTAEDAAKPASPESPSASAPPAEAKSAAKADTAPAEAGKKDGARADDVYWLPVQRDCGPLHLAKIGVGLRQTGESWELTALLAGKISLSGVQLGLIDAGISVAIDKLSSPRGHLKGLSLSVKRGAVSVEGGFLRISDTVYGGQLSIQLPKLSIGVLGVYGSYKVDERSPPVASLFVYGTLSLTGGAGLKMGAITITGLALGFGVNRRVVVPAIGDVADFPLVKLVMKNDAASGSPSAESMLTTLEQHLPFDHGQMFAAIGLRFTIAEAIDAFALAIAQFGKELDFALLGLARFEKSVGSQTFCNIELAIKMTLRPSEGSVLLQAELTRNAWVFDPSCRLTGGFALGVWFTGARKGDFVLTVGGYHRDFKVPAHYPTVPRLGLNWPVTPELTVKGELYCALTPSHMMAGGRLEASFVRDRIKAWFVAEVDFLLKWAPLEYQLDAGIAIRVQADLPIKTIDLSLDVLLRLWGPPFAGRATVKLPMLSFDIAFGESGTVPKITGWNEFGALFLDKSSQAWAATPTDGGSAAGPAICTAALVSGLLTQPGDRQPKGPWVVRGDELALSVSSVLPATTLCFGTATGTLPSRRESAVNRTVAKALALCEDPWTRAAAETRLGIVPLSIRDATSTLAVTVLKDRPDGTVEAVDLKGWILMQEQQAMPAALWDLDEPSSAPGAKLTKPYLTGLASAKPPGGERREEGGAARITRHLEKERVFQGTRVGTPEPFPPQADAPPPASAGAQGHDDLTAALAALGLSVAPSLVSTSPANTVNDTKADRRGLRAQPMTRSW